MSDFRKLVLVVLGAWLAGSAATAQVPDRIRAEHRNGQTFLTWREIAATDKRYRVYRSERPMRVAQDLKDADLLGEVDDRSSRNQGRSLANGSETTWVIAPDREPLDADQGLFVYTTEGFTPRAYYAVTSVQAGGENRTLAPGKNATVYGLWERVGPPQPVIQQVNTDGVVYGHWVSDRATPFQPALSPWPSRGYNFLFQPGDAPGPRGLVLRLHAAGQTYGQGWPQRFEVPADVDVLGPSDLIPYTSWSFWYGAQELLPGAPAADSRVHNFTQRRILWTLDWLTAFLGAEHDPERVYVSGGSMGAIGGMYLLSETPERFAAALLRNGLYDLEATDYRNPEAFERLFGDFELDLLTDSGLPIFARTNASFMANLEPWRDWPVIRTMNGRSDETVGWESAVGMFAGLARAGRPATHYFDERTHNPNGYWRDLERVLLARTFQTRRDRPSLRFEDCTLDDDPGTGARDDGDAIGTINGYVEYDPRTASATSEELFFDVYLRDAGVLDDAPRARAMARMRPWRTGSFAPEAGEAILYTLHEGGRIVDEHLLFADEHGRVRTPPAPLTTTRRECRFERYASTRRTLFMGEAPLSGRDVQVVLSGPPLETWTLFLGVRSAPLARAGVAGPAVVLHGTLDERGLADLALPLPRLVRGGARIWARAVIGRTPTPQVTVTVQGWTRPPADRVRRR